MLKQVLVTLIIGVALVVGDAKFNDKVDKLLEESTSGWVGTDVFYWYGFKEYIPVTLFGFKLPVSVYINAFNGSIFPDGHSMSRLGDAEELQNGVRVKLTYDKAVLTYEKVQVKFLFFETSGKLSMSIEKPEALVSLSLCEGLMYGPQIYWSSRGIIEYQLSDTRSLEGWLLGKILHRSLLNNNNNAMLTSVLNAFGEYFNAFITSYCSPKMVGL